MIGDANGNTSEELDISTDNPYLERYVKLLNSLKPNKGSWGVMLNLEDLDSFLEEKQITEDDYQFLKKMMFEEWDENDEDNSTFIVEPENLKHSQEFYDGVMADTEYSFLVFEGIYLQYVDENNVKHETIIE